MAYGFFNSASGSAGSAIPFQRVADAAHMGQFLNLEQSELIRIQRQAEHWRFYYGRHWNFDREDSEPLVTLNFIRLAVDKSVSFLVKNGFEIDVPEALEHVTEPFLEEVWGYNEKKKLLYDIGTTGAVTGDAFVLVTYDEPTEQARRANPHSEGKIRIQLYGSEQVFPAWDPLDVDVMTSVRIETIYYDDKNMAAADENYKANHAGRQQYVRKFTQIITPDEIIEQYEGGQPVRRSNILGEIPVVHIKNLPLPREFYGLSDMDGIVDLQREINEKATDVSDIISYQAAPTTVITGAKAGQLERGARMIWSGLPADARVSNLSLDSDLAASYNYLAFIKDSLFQIAEIPKVMFEDPAISNASGVALAMQYQPILDRTQRKKPQYETGLQDINYYILRIASTLGQLFLPYDLCSHCGGRIVEVLDNTGPFPRTVKRCYHINRSDFSFKTPEQFKIPHIRQHSFGEEYREDTLEQVRREHLQLNPSMWDPQKQESAEEKQKRDAEKLDSEIERNRAEEDRQKEIDLQAKPAPEGAKKPEGPKKVGWNTKDGKAPRTQPDEPEPPKMGGVKLPSEPEPVVLSFVWVHPTTGEQVYVERKLLMLVPTECERPAYLDPYKTTVHLRDSLPRDVHLEAQLHQQYLGMGIVSKEWVMDHSHPLTRADKRDILEQLQSERRKGHPLNAAPVEGEGFGEDGNLEAPQTGMQGMDLQRKLGAIGGKKSKPPSSEKK